MKTYKSNDITLIFMQDPFLTNVENPFIIKPKKKPKDKLNKPNLRWVSFKQENTIIDEKKDFLDCFRYYDIHR